MTRRHREKGRERDRKRQRETASKDETSTAGTKRQRDADETSTAGTHKHRPQRQAQSWALPCKSCPTQRQKTTGAPVSYTVSVLVLHAWCCQVCSLIIECVLLHSSSEHTPVCACACTHIHSCACACTRIHPHHIACKRIHSHHIVASVYTHIILSHTQTHVHTP